jgi:hypothetical protein
MIKNDNLCAMFSHSVANFFEFTFADKVASVRRLSATADQRDRVTTCRQDEFFKLSQVGMRAGSL